MKAVQLKRPAADNIVQLLEDLVVQAKDGTIRHVSVSIVGIDGSTGEFTQTMWAGAKGMLPATVGGAIDLLRWRWWQHVEATKD